MNQFRRLTQAYSQTPWRKQTQGIGLFLALLGMSAIVWVAYLNVTARTGTMGRRVQEMQAEILEIERTNADLVSQYAELTSMEVLEARALEMGFRPLNIGEPIYLEVPGYSDLSEAELAPPPGPAVGAAPAHSPAFDQSLVDWVKKQIFLPTSPLLEAQP
jgi:hypothetical protein